MNTTYSPSALVSVPPAVALLDVERAILLDSVDSLGGTELGHA